MKRRPPALAPGRLFCPALRRGLLRLFHSPLVAQALKKFGEHFAALLAQNAGYQLGMMVIRQIEQIHNRAAGTGFGSPAPKTTREIRAFRIAPVHMGQGSKVT